jgi:hypothetical protein
LLTETQEFQVRAIGDVPTVSIELFIPDPIMERARIDGPVGSALSIIRQSKEYGKGGEMPSTSSNSYTLNVTMRNIQHSGLASYVNMRL